MARDDVQQRSRSICTSVTAERAYGRGEISFLLTDTHEPEACASAFACQLLASFQQESVSECTRQFMSWHSWNK